MCGIAGILSDNQSLRTPNIVTAMTDAIAHRGPDDSGQYHSTSISLGFRRLSIIDIAGGHQPMTTQDRRYTIVFNGEIYNYKELKAQLLPSPAYDFITASDTEVILFAFALWGSKAFTRFNGMFALAIWDSYERQLTLARDRMGKKPLYYFLTDDTLIFASEIKSLLTHPSITAHVAADRIPDAVTYRYVPGYETLFASIHTLPTASFAEVNADVPYKVIPQTYWSPISEKHTASLPASDPVAVALDQLHYLLQQSVKRRLMAEVPVGAFLSGGIDSSLITALASREVTTPLKTFSIGFDTGFSEHSFAQSVARVFQTDHHEIIVSAADLLQHIPAVLWHRESPISEPSDIPIYILSRQARQHVKVVLSGEGSDEVFAGYPKYRCARLMNHTLRTLLRLPASALSSLYADSSSPLGIALSAVATKNNQEFSARWFGAFPENERTRLLDSALAHHPVHEFSRHLPHDGLTPIQQMQLQDLSHWLPANLLLRADRMTMAHGLELRCPFLDPAIISFGLQALTEKQKVRGSQTKWLVTQLAQRLLPTEISARRKWGFKVPVKEWFRGPLANSLKEILLSNRSQARGYFQPNTIARLVHEHTTGKADHTKQLWFLYQLELWHLMFIDHQLKPTDSLC